MITDQERAYLFNHINDHSIFRVGRGMDLLPGKAPSSFYTWQFYLRRTLYDRQASRIIGKYFWGLHYDGAFQLCACEDAGVPVMMSILQHPDGVHVNAFSIKKEPKSYGLHNKTEGRIIPGCPVLLLDDLSGSQKTLIRATNFLEENGLTVLGSFTIVDKDVSGHPEAYPNDKRLNSIFKASEFDLTYNRYHIHQRKPPEFANWL